MPTTAARNSVRVVDGETCAHQAINIVNLAAVDIAKTHLVYQHFDAALLDEGVAILLFVKRHAILKTRATTAGDKDAQGEGGVIFLLQQFAHFFCGSRCNGKNADLDRCLRVLLDHVCCLSLKVEFSTSMFVLVLNRNR